MLNGEHLYLKGVSVHQDRPVKGWAVSDADQEEDFAIPGRPGRECRAAGALSTRSTLVRGGECPAGIMVWAEIPLVNAVSYDGSPAMRTRGNARQQLLELIQQNRNHPSVALLVDCQRGRSCGNAYLGRPSKPGSLLLLAQTLSPRTQDPDRPTTFADCCEVAWPPNP